MTQPMRILYCHCAFFETTPADVRGAVLEGMAAAGLEFTPVRDLCELAARRDPILAEMAAGEGSRTIVACRPRTVRWLFEAAGATLEPSAVRFVDLRESTAEEALAVLTEGAACEEGGCGCGAKIVRAVLENLDANAWRPWFPVIDYDRCVGCGQCMDFCLFGVYERDDEGRVVAAHPEKCKTNCPACARVCPEAAIIFPKYLDGPISGLPVTEADTGDPVRVDLAGLAKGDVYEKLRKRDGGSGGRFSGTYDGAQAEAERAECSCVSRMMERLGVTPEVLAASAADAREALAAPSETPGGGCACDEDAGCDCDGTDEERAAGACGPRGCDCGGTGEET